MQQPPQFQQPPPFVPPPQYQQQQAPYYNQPQPPLTHKSMKSLALWMFIISWVCGIIGALLTFTIITACAGIPLLIVAFVTHILGFVFLAQIREV